MEKTLERTPCAGVIVFQEEKVLLVQHTLKSRQPPGSFGFPAGRMESGEYPKITAQRELWQEARLRVKIRDLREYPGNLKLGSPLTMGNGTTEQFMFHTFICTKFSGKIKPSKDGKTIPEWVEIPGVPSLYLVGDTAEMVLEALKYK
jgi:8-oxo-dGTP pyrophosphatase MutT (NUDIX family)